MRIERLSDNQIRCTLNKQDLQERQLQLNELFYGSDKAKELFHDLMQMASYECGFDTEDLPLMIEAIPVDPDCLVLVVTKVEDTDELDSRFSNFTPSNEKNVASPNQAIPALADEILKYFSHMRELLSDKTDAEEKSTNTSEQKKVTLTENLVKAYRFTSFDDVCQYALAARAMYKGDFKVYRDPIARVYYILIDIEGLSAKDFNKLCNIASEFGQSVSASPATQLFYEEHYIPVQHEDLMKLLSDMAPTY